MKRTKLIMLLLLISLIVMAYFWVNRIDTPFKRVVSILIISTISYWIGRLHERICLNEIRADGMDSSQNPPSYY